jgi:hypothetical protein
VRATTASVSTAVIGANQAAVPLAKAGPTFESYLLHSAAD